MPKRFVLLDRDGTIIVEKNYLSDPDQIELLPHAAAGLRHLNALGFGLVLITNQSGIGRGYFTRLTVDTIHVKLAELLSADGVVFDGVYLCPHTPDDQCSCRKPEPGLALQAAAELHFDPKQAIVIGDKPCDIDLASRIGAKSILVRTGYGESFWQTGQLHPDLVACDLEDAARLLAQN
jgi:D-glycero-D-manno-heptose 1,7-bisphosphate phosphatase